MRILFFIFAIILFACKEEPKPNSTTQGEYSPTHDPYFVQTIDTVSTKGPQSITRNVLQDKNGNLWFATWEGILCYDGKRFTNVTLLKGLIHFHVFSLLEDNDGYLWFGTIGGGVYKYDGKTFTLFTTKNGLSNNIITCMMEEKSGNIWFGTEHGASRYDGKSFTNFTTEDGLSSNSVNTIVQDKYGRIWLGTRVGISYYDGGSFTDIENLDDLSFYNVRSIIEDKTGNIWIGSQDGFWSHEPSTSLMTMRKPLQKISSLFTGFIFEDKNGDLWLSQEDGKEMALFRYKGNAFTKITSSGQVFGITEDRTGKIWFGTERGVYCYDGKSVMDFH
ncbi:MAG: histidine kinase [Ignavibacteriae bacterium]|nr:histidine kinase [Ignavibacteriota bacterium]